MTNGDTDTDVEEGEPDSSGVTTAEPRALVPRAATGTAARAAIVLNRIEIYFQVYPGTQTIDGTDIGIGTQHYEIEYADGSIATGNTEDTGRIEILLPAGTQATLRFLGTEYLVSARANLESIRRLAGVQRRLAMIGYDLGDAGVDGSNGSNTEKAVLDFQYDASLDIDARRRRRFRQALATADWAGE